MNIHKILIDGAIRFPRVTMLLMLIVFVALALQIPRLTIDTDPENMLPPDQAERVFHNVAKEKFDLYDLIVVGVVNEEHPEGVFNVTSLTHIHELTRRIEKIEGVIRHDLMSLASVDNISQDGPGVVRFEWMLDEPPASEEAALQIRDNAKRLPAIDGTLISEDGMAAGIYVPIEDKDQSHRIATEIKAIVAALIIATINHLDFFFLRYRRRSTHASDAQRQSQKH